MKRLLTELLEGRLQRCKHHRNPAETAESPFRKILLSGDPLLSGTAQQRPVQQTSDDVTAAGLSECHVRGIQK